MEKFIKINASEYLNIESYLNDLDDLDIDINNLSVQELKMHKKNLNIIRAFMIQNMKSLGFRYQELEQYFKRHFPNDYEDNKEGMVYVIERK